VATLIYLINADMPREGMVYITHGADHNGRPVAVWLTLWWVEAACVGLEHAMHGLEEPCVKYTIARRLHSRQEAGGVLRPREVQCLD
jgi:hypothetical protein